MASLIVWAVLLAPIVYLLSVIRINRGATKIYFGYLHDRGITSITGHLANYQRIRDDNARLHEIIRLKLPNGQEWETDLVEFDLSPNLGDVITVAKSATEGQATFAALDHTTQESRAIRSAVMSMQMGSFFSTYFKVNGSIFFLLICLVLGILLSQPAIVLWGVFPWAIFVTRSININRFVKYPRPLWNAVANSPGFPASPIPPAGSIP